MGHVSPWRVELIPAANLLPEYKCPGAALTSTASSTAACVKLGLLSQLVCIFFSAYSYCVEGRFRDLYPSAWGDIITSPN